VLTYFAEGAACLDEWYAINLTSRLLALRLTNRSDMRALLAEARALLEPGECWSKLYADRAFRLQAIVSTDQFRHHEHLTRRYLQCLTSVHRSNSSTPSGANDSAAPTGSPLRPSHDPLMSLQSF